MDIPLLGQYVMNGLMLGVMYGLVAVGFTLFFGVLDVIKFSHGDVLTVGVFTGFATFLGLKAAQVGSPLRSAHCGVGRRHGGDGRARRGDRPLPGAAAALRPGAQHAAHHTDAGNGAARRRAAIFPDGSNPKPFPRLLPDRRLYLRQFQPAARQPDPAGGGARHDRRRASPDQQDQARARDPRGRAGRRDRPYHGDQFQLRGADDVRHRLRRSPPSPA